MAKARIAEAAIAGATEAGGIGSAIGAEVAIGTVGVLADRAEGIATGVDVAECLKKFCQDCVPRISIKNRKQRDKN